MDYTKEYEKWICEKSLSDAGREELLSLNEKEKEDRFYTHLSFGTAGLRGILGMGTNRMNVYTVRRATQGLASTILALGRREANRGVVIGMDCRNMSDIFAREAACVLAANKIPVYLFESLRPTPELSFAIRALGAISGINITASHNPKEYNGYKVYWEDGAQLPTRKSDAVLSEMEKIDLFSGAKTMDFDKAVKKGIITLIGEEVDEAFMVHVLGAVIDREPAKKVGKDFKIVYTPFYGTGYKIVPEVLLRAGFENVISVKEQSVPDGNFPTVRSPNPEDPEGFALAVELAKKENADIIIGTDPDADRVAVMCRTSDGEYDVLSGNCTGVMLLDYMTGALSRCGRLSKDAYAVKSIVTTEMARAVCEKNGVRMYETFTGFKYIAGKVSEIGARGFVMGYEESIGYLIGDFCRDKDAITASMMIAEMAAYHKSQGKTLFEAMDELYEKYGAYAEKTLSVVMPGIDGVEKREAIMKKLRENPPGLLAGTKVIKVRDYLTGETDSGEKLPISGSNVLYFELEDDTRFIVRPSGTEPKIKVYILAHAKTRADAEQNIEKYYKIAEDITK